MANILCEPLKSIKNINLSFVVGEMVSVFERYEEHS